MIAEEAVELLVARAFLTGDAPASRERGFARVIRWLAGWDWAAGVRVSLFDEPDPAHVTEDAKAPVEVEVKGGVWRIMTAVDEKGTMWTTRGPDALVARRVREIARATWDAMKDGSVDVQVSIRYYGIFVHAADLACCRPSSYTLQTTTTSYFSSSQVLSLVTSRQPYQNLPHGEGEGSTRIPHLSSRTAMASFGRDGIPRVHLWQTYGTCTRTPSDCSTIL